jgi:hypothetical protein
MTDRDSTLAAAVVAAGKAGGRVKNCFARAAVVVVVGHLDFAHCGPEGMD